MKLRVNLYQPVLQPRTEQATLSQFATAVAVSVLLLLLLIFWCYQQLSLQRQQAAAVDVQTQQQMQQLDGLQQQLANRKPSATLSQQAVGLQQSLSQKQQLLSYLQQQQNQPPVRYAAVLQHLAAIDQPGIWLTGFVLGATPQFQGVVKDSQALPLWLQALGASPQLQGQSFSLVQLQPLADGDYLQFNVQGQRPAVAVTESSAVIEIPAVPELPAGLADLPAIPATSSPPGGGQP